MSDLKNVHWKELGGRLERMIARVELKARCNTIFGGMSALTLVNRLHGMGGEDLRFVVHAVYSLSSGRPHPQYAAFECPECGTACLGEESAQTCCSHMEEDPEDEQS